MDVEALNYKRDLDAVEEGLRAYKLSLVCSH